MRSSLVQSQILVRGRHVWLAHTLLAGRERVLQLVRVVSLQWRELILQAAFLARPRLVAQEQIGLPDDLVRILLRLE